jgi:hypothetical protein
MTLRWREGDANSRSHRERNGRVEGARSHRRTERVPELNRGPGRSFRDLPSATPGRAFRKRRDRGFESAFLQRRVINELLPPPGYASKQRETTGLLGPHPGYGMGNNSMADPDTGTGDTPTKSRALPTRRQSVWVRHLGGVRRTVPRAAEGTALMPRGRAPRDCPAPRAPCSPLHRRFVAGDRATPVWTASRRFRPFAGPAK